MTLNEKIERVRELLSRRDEIETELSELLGGSVAEVSAPRVNTPKAKAPASKETNRSKPPKNVGGRKVGSVHLCSGCGKQGHSIRTCPEARGQHPDNPKPDTTSEPLDEDQYAELRDAMHDREFMSARYSLTHKLPPREVNAAIRSTDYEDYFASR